MKRYLSIIRELGSLSVMYGSEYRSDFLVMGLFELAQAVASFLILVFLFQQVKGIADWKSNDVLVINLTFSLTAGIAGLFLKPGLQQLADELNEGRIDKYLVAPLNFQVYTLLARWDWSQIFRIGGGIAAVAYMLGRTGRLGPWSLAGYTVMIGVSVVLFYALAFILVCSVFFVKRLYSVTFLAEILWDAGRYPASIFGGVWKIAVMTILPIGFAATVPVGVLTGRYGWELIFMGLGLAASFLVVSDRVLKIGIRRYAGAGG